MDARHLQVNDWVLCNGEPLKLNIEHIYNIISDTEWTKKHKYEPMALTPEALSSTGLFSTFFDDHGFRSNYVKKDEYTEEPVCYIDVFFNSKKRPMITNINNNKLTPYPHDARIRVSVGTVYEFQHILRDMGLENIADNLEVE